MGIKFQCKITSQELWNERLRRESDLTFRMDILYVIPTSKHHSHSCSNETFDIQVQFEVQVGIILWHAIQNMIKQEGRGRAHWALTFPVCYENKIS